MFQVIHTFRFGEQEPTVNISRVYLRATAIKLALRFSEEFLDPNINQVRIIPVPRMYAR